MLEPSASPPTGEKALRGVALARIRGESMGRARMGGGLSLGVIGLSSDGGGLRVGLGACKVCDLGMGLSRAARRGFGWHGVWSGWEGAVGCHCEGVG